jgi:hypothetical protein
MEAGVNTCANDRMCGRTDFCGIPAAAARPRASWARRARCYRTQTRMPLARRVIIRPGEDAVQKRNTGRAAQLPVCLRRTRSRAHPREVEKERELKSRNEREREKKKRGGRQTSHQLAVQPELEKFSARHEARRALRLHAAVRRVHAAQHRPLRHQNRAHLRR